MTKRKVLAVVSACTLLLTMFVSLIPVYAGKPDDTTGWDVKEGTTLTGNADYGWSLTQEFDDSIPDADRVNNYTTDIRLRDLQIQFVMDSADNTQWSVNLGDKAFNRLPNADQLGSTGMSFILEKHEGYLTFIRWSGGNLYYGQIQGFDFSIPHTLHFVENEGKWYPALDGNIVAVTDGLDVTAVLNATDNAAQTVFGSATVVGTPKFTYINFADAKEIADWRLSGTVTAEGDATNGYNLTGNGQATYKTPLKLGEQSVTMTFDPGVGNWLALSFSPNDGLGGLVDLTENQFGLVITHGNGTEIPDTSLRVSLWNSEITKEEAIVVIDNYDFTAEHSFGFSKVDDSWYLNVDGRLYTTAEASVTEKLTNVLNNIAEENSYAGLQAFTGTLDISGFRFTATQHPDDDSDWRLSGEAKAEGDRENGYALSGKGYAAYKTPFDMADWSVKMQFVPTFDDSNPEQIVNGWQAIVFSDVCTVDTTVLPGVPTQGGEHNVLTFILGREANGTTMRLSLFMQVGENKAERAIAYISNFDWEAEHTFGFAKVGDNWYVVFDGKTYTSPSGDTEDRIITSAITDVLNAMNGKDAYIRVEASDALNMPKFNLVETGRNEPEEGEWELSTDMTAEETANGWTVSGIPGMAGWKEVFAVDQDVFRIQFKPEVGNWAYFSIGDTYSVSAEQFMGPDNANNMICFILGRENETTLRLSMWNGTAESAMVYIHSFDFDKAHDFQFVQRRGNWYLSIDGRTILSPQGDGDDKIITNWITEAVNNLKGNEAYIRVSAWAGVPITLTNIQMIGEGHDNSSGSQTGVVFPIAAVAALGVSFLAVLVLRKKKA